MFVGIRRLKLLLVAAIVAIATVGCGDNSDNGGGPSSAQKQAQFLPLHGQISGPSIEAAIERKAGGPEGLNAICPDKIDVDQGSRFSCRLIYTNQLEKFEATVTVIDADKGLIRVQGPLGVVHVSGIVRG